jgi:hypothetical protein
MTFNMWKKVEFEGHIKIEKDTTQFTGREHSCCREIQSPSDEGRF